MAAGGFAAASRSPASMPDATAPTATASLGDTAGCQQPEQAPRQNLQRQAQLIALLDAERQRMAAEVHDSLAQSLAFVKMRMPLLEDALLGHEEARALKYCGDVRSAVSQAHASLRGILTHFRSPMDPQGLVHALEAAAGHFGESSGVELEFVNELPALKLGPEAEAQVFHIVREALSNVARHARARHAWLHVAAAPDGRIEIVIADDGEMLVRAPLVMKGYRGDPEKTAEAIDADGWLHTGDIAQIDGDGYVRIVDRKKELIINSAGKNMSPANIELKLRASSRLIAHAVCIGDRRPYNVALIALDREMCAGRAPDELRSAIETAVAAANAELSRVEQVKRIAIVDADWLPGGDELTPTMKLKRKPIQQKYASEIEELYR